MLMLRTVFSIFLLGLFRKPRYRERALGTFYGMLHFTVKARKFQSILSILDCWFFNIIS